MASHGRMLNGSSRRTEFGESHPTMEQTIHRHINTIEYTTQRIYGRGGYSTLLRENGGTKTVKKASKVLIEKYYPRLTLDFQTNKKIASEVAIIPSKRLRNKIAGFTTHLMKRIQRGPVR
ncbi:40S ribosomal protein S17, partial [Podila epicladia]